MHISKTLMKVAYQQKHLWILTVLTGIKIQQKSRQARRLNLRGKEELLGLEKEKKWRSAKTGTMRVDAAMVIRFAIFLSLSYFLV